MITKPVNIGLVQINNSFSGQNYLPYSIALLQGYAQANTTDPDRYNFMMPVYKREPIGDLVRKLENADIVGFSAYVWNCRISLEVARRLKERQPEVLILFGGPQVPDSPEAFLRDNPFIDLVVHNEGEARFLEILEAYPGNDWSNIASISYIAPQGNFVKTPAGTRFRDLDEVPSPFLNGIFDDLIRTNPDERWIGLWETNRGCPFRCTFCDWGSATAAKITKFEIDRLYQEVDWFSKNKIEFIFCCDANFGIQKRDVEIAEYVAQIKQESGYPQALSVQNTKNATERAYLTQKILADAGLNKGVALSMQSVDQNTLVHIKRDNISLDTYMELQRRFTNDNIETYSDLILGLPGETYESFVEGVSSLIENGQHNRIQFNNLSILPNAEMGNAEYQKEHGMVTVESKIINIHGERVELKDDVPEIQDLVIATNSMPPTDWRRTRAFGWMSALLHFDKIFQIPLMVANTTTGVSYRHLVEGFLNADSATYPLIAEISAFFEKEARSIQDGGPEYVFSPEWLGIYWPADEYVFIKLTAENNLSAFYAEASRLLDELIGASATEVSRSALPEALRLNEALIRQPFATDDLVIPLDVDLLAYYNAVRRNEPPTLTWKPVEVHINRTDRAFETFNDWCREVVWWGNKKGAYLYTSQNFERQLAGHY